MIDAHCHLNFPQFAEDLDEVIKRAKNAGVNEIINVGTGFDSNQKVIELAEKYSGLYATVGVHPHDAERMKAATFDKLSVSWEKEFEELAKHPKVVAIGETGLDYYGKNVDKKAQEKLFVKQIEISIKLKLPLQIHNRQAGNDILDILLNYKSQLLNPPGLFHCFSGNLEFLKKVLNLGFYVGFDGNITYSGIAKNETTALSELVKYAPVNRIIAETDAPFLAPIPHRGSRNEPSYVIIVASAIGQIKKLSQEEVIEKTVQNAHTVFKIR